MKRKKLQNPSNESLRFPERPSWDHEAFASTEKHDSILDDLDFTFADSLNESSTEESAKSCCSIESQKRSSKKEKKSTRRTSRNSRKTVLRKSHLNLGFFQVESEIVRFSEFDKQMVEYVILEDDDSQEPSSQVNSQKANYVELRTNVEQFNQTINIVNYNCFCRVF